MKIIITGGTGFVGQHVAEHYLKAPRRLVTGENAVSSCGTSAAECSTGKTPKMRSGDIPRPQGGIPRSESRLGTGCTGCPPDGVTGEADHRHTNRGERH
ncbi:NAD-dependent epimerase/dehydratase family protein [Fimbriiglobus ruber]|uniref:NAD-dependent epimerase/dehydratase family protein n=1 Tax=Fimbriiglobus ruber TaxID=1908690 RepID=UPI003B8457AB